MKAVIFLGCNGRKNEKFNFCNGVENKILDLDNITASNNYSSLIEYLNNITKIFNIPCYKSHIITNAIYKMYELNFIQDNLYKEITIFYGMHFKCGLILKAYPKNNIF